MRKASHRRVLHVDGWLFSALGNLFWIGSAKAVKPLSYSGNTPICMTSVYTRK